jgi:hypothetical protein
MPKGHPNEEPPASGDGSGDGGVRQNSRLRLLSIRAARKKVSDDDEQPPPLSREEAIAIMKGGLGEAELALAASFCAPLYWINRIDFRLIEVRNGSAFFLDAGKGPFGVTAYHVVKKWQQHREGGSGLLRLGGEGNSVEFDYEDRKIAFHPGLDIATFRIGPEEIRRIGKTIITGTQSSWPPKPPAVKRGIYYCGFPQNQTRQLSVQKVEFGSLRGSGVASAVNDRDIVTLIEREEWITGSRPGPPENFDFGGISGGIMTTVVEGRLRSWRLAGMIYEGPRTSDDPNEAIPGFEIIRARRADFLKPDGTLDTALWHFLGGTDKPPSEMHEPP